MEQRIKIIWMLSLAAMLLIIAGQGYRLWNQYRYKNEECADDMYRRVMDAVAVNDSIRRTMPRKTFGASNVSLNTSISLSYRDQKDSLNPAGRQEYRQVVKVGTVDTDELLKASISDLMPDTVRLSRTGKDSIGVRTDRLNMQFVDSLVLSNEDGYSGGVDIVRVLDQYKLQVDVPFTLQRFDSILQVRLDGMPFTTQLTHVRDTLYRCKEKVTHLGTSLFPVLQVDYPYNPMKFEQVRVQVQILPHALLLRMGWQLLGSLLLILLLACCLLFQIKTILRQRRIDEMRKNFVNTMIHELKRPVQTLKTCVAFLSHRELCADPQAMEEVIHDSRAGLDNLSAYLQKLRDMTRADDGQAQLTVTTFRLRETVDNLVLLQQSATDKQTSFEVRIDPSLTVRADRLHFSNIISNLLENAVKYSGDAVHIVIEAAVTDARLTLSVADNGIGIPLAEQARVFDKFYRSASLPDPAVPGIGLGLSYVKLLTEAHRGTVTLRSRPGQGTTVTVSIPQ